MRRPSTIGWNIRTQEISGIVVKYNAAYVKSPDGYLFGIKLDYSMDVLEMNDIIFEDTDECNRISGCVRFTKRGPHGVHFDKQ